MLPQFWWHIWIRRPRKPPGPLFPPNRTNFINWPKKCPYYKGMLDNLDVSIIYSNMSYLYIKFDDRDVAEHVRPTVLDVCSNFIWVGSSWSVKVLCDLSWFCGVWQWRIHPIMVRVCVGGGVGEFRWAKKTVHEDGKWRIEIRQLIYKNNFTFNDKICTRNFIFKLRYCTKFNLGVN